MPEHRPVRSVLLCVAALALFACMDTTTKNLSAHYDIPLIMAGRSCRAGSHLPAPA